VAEANERQAIASAELAELKEKEAKKERDDAKRQRNEIQTLNDELKATQAELKTTLYAAHMNLAKQAWDARGIRRVEELLMLHLPKPGESDLRGFEWRYLYRLSQPELVLWHKGNVNCVAYSPDGKRLASGNFGEVKVWEAQTGKALSTIAVNQQSVISVAFSPDGKRLATGQFDAPKDERNLRIWDVQTRKKLLTLKGYFGKLNGGASYRVSFSPDGTRLAGGAADNTVKVWDAESGKELLTLKGHTGGEFTRGVNCVAYSPDGKRLASSSSGEIKVWDAKTDKELLTLDGGALDVAFSPDGERLASNSRSAVTVWNAKTGEKILTIKDIRGGVRSVAFSPDGKRLATGSGDLQLSFAGPRDQGGDVKVWDAQTGKELATIPAHTSLGVDVAFSPDGKHLASAGDDDTVKVWDAQALQKPLILKAAQDNKSDVVSVVFSSDGKRLAATVRGRPGIPNGEESAVVKVWDAQTGKELFSLKGGMGVAFSPDGKLLAFALSDSTVKLLDTQTGKELHTLKGHTGGVRSVAFSPDGKRLTTGGLAGPGGKGKPWDAQIMMWDVQTGKDLFSQNGGPAGIFSPDGKRLASASPLSPDGGQDIKVCDAQTGKDLDTFEGSKDGPIGSLAFSPDGTLLASTVIVFEGDDGPGNRLKVWHTQTRKELFNHKLHGFYVVFSPDGKRLASNTDNGVMVWDAQTGKKLLTLKGQVVGVNRVLFRPDDVVFSPDGKRLAAVASDTTVKVWDAQTGQELLTLKGQGGLAFSPDGHLLAAGSAGGTVTVWDATPRPEKR
jgi:WD40 repeat protein